MKENSIKNERSSIEEAIERLEYIDRTYSCNNYYSIWDLKCIEILLSDYKRVLEMNEVLLKENEELLEVKVSASAHNKILELEKQNELLRKDVEGWKKYCEEIEEEQTEMSNKNCKLEFDVEKLQKENEELKADNYELNNRINDLLDNISVQKVKDKIEKYKKLSDKFYVKFLESDRYNIDIREKGIKCDAIILALEELIEEKEEE